MNHFKDSMEGRVLARVLDQLRRRLRMEGALLRKGESTLLTLGAPPREPLLSLPFLEYTLLLPLSGESLPADLQGTVDLACRIASSILGAMRQEEKREENQDRQSEAAAMGGALGSLRLSELVEILLARMETTEPARSSDRWEHYETILRLNKSVLLADDLESVLQIIMEEARRATRGTDTSLLLVDPRTGELYFNTTSGDDRMRLKQVRIPAGQGIAGSVVQSAKPELIRKVEEDPRFFQNVDRLLRQKTVDMVVAPIIARERVIGVIEVINSQREEGFTEEDLAFLTSIADRTSLLLDNARTREDLVRSNRELDRKVFEINTAHEIAIAMLDCESEEDLKEKLTRTLVQIPGMRKCHLLLPSIDSRRMAGELVARKRDHQEIALERSSTLLEGTTDILLWMKRNREPFFLLVDDDTLEYAGLARRIRSDNPGAEGMENSIWIPVLEVNGDTIHYILILETRAGELPVPARDRAFFQNLMEQIVVQVQNLHLHFAMKRENLRERTLRQKFQSYVPEEVLRDIPTENPKEQRGRIQSREAAVLAIHIRDLVALERQYNPGMLLEDLDAFMDLVSGLIAEHGGTLDRFTGTSLIALFHPEGGNHVAVRSLRAARSIAEELGSFHRRQQEKGRIHLPVGMGLHTGRITIGSGDAHRPPPLLGEPVVLALRLSKMAPQLATSLLYSEQVMREGRGEVPGREVDTVALRGSPEPIRIYEYMEEERYDRFLRIQEQWNMALQEYRNGAFPRSAVLFSGISAALGTDPVVDSYLERCRRSVEKPPEKEWKGVFILDS